MYVVHIESLEFVVFVVDCIVSRIDDYVSFCL